MPAGEQGEEDGVRGQSGRRGEHPVGRARDDEGPVGIEAVDGDPGHRLGGDPQRTRDDALEVGVGPPGCLGELGGHRSRAQRRHGHPPIVHLNPERLGIGEDKRLARRVASLPGQRLEGGSRGDVQDRPPTPLHHAGDRPGAEVDHRLDVGPHHRHLVLGDGTVHWPERGEPGVVDQHVDGQAAVGQLGKEPGPLVGIGHVARHDLGTDVVTSCQLTGERVEPVAPSGHERDTVAAGGELPGDGGADARRRPGDEAGAVGPGCRERHGRSVRTDAGVGPGRPGPCRYHDAVPEDDVPVRRSDDAAPAGSNRPGGGPGGGHHLPRRRFLAGAAVTGAVAVVAGVVGDLAGGSSANRVAARPRRVRQTPRPPQVVDTRMADGVVLPVSSAILAENAKPGAAWWVTTPQRPGDIWGYASTTSAVHGDDVTLFVSTTAPHFHVEAYRMGYYQGIGGRLVWQSDEVAGAVQAPPTVVAPTNTVECHWAPSLTIRVDPTWPPGAYLLKLVGPTGQQQFVPLCVRDDQSTAAVVLLHCVTTWQAYNRWGGYSLYYGNTGGKLTFTHAPGGGNYQDRARIVSFDRPYDWDWASGAADFVGNELPVVFHAEKLGLDVTNWTDIDLHARGDLLTRHRALVSLGHDEYWSYEMRAAARAALDAGVNLAFLGANACYRQIRLDATAIGPHRHQVCYKSAAEDPFTGHDNARVTVNWPQPPVNRPESSLIGDMYQDIGAVADLVVTDASAWLFAGTGLTSGQHLAKVVVGEFDRYVPGGAGPANCDVLAHSLVANRGGNYSDITWYTVPGGGGVFASGNASWVGNLVQPSLIPPNVLPPANPANAEALVRMTENLYGVIALGPASATQPSQGTWRAAYGVHAPALPGPSQAVGA